MLTPESCADTRLLVLCLETEPLPTYQRHENEGAKLWPDEADLNVQGA